jgi:hypothetical protein
VKRRQSSEFSLFFNDIYMCFAFEPTNFPCVSLLLLLLLLLSSCICIFICVNTSVTDVYGFTCNPIRISCYEVPSDLYITMKTGEPVHVPHDQDPYYLPDWKKAEFQRIAANATSTNQQEQQPPPPPPSTTTNVTNPPLSSSNDTKNGTVLQGGGGGGGDTK